MTGVAPLRAITLAVHPSTHGFGWAAFTGPFSPYDWGSVSAKGAGKNERCLRKIEKLLDRLTPQALVLEAFEPSASSRRTRVARLGRAVVALANAKGVDVAVYSFKDVRGCFAHMGATTRCEIAETIGRQFAAFGHLVPRRRRAWDPEHWRTSLFSAVALVLTHYQRDAGNLLSHLSA
ncbi:MAG: hypothetical protein WDN31_02180 [Hyphomicrobium sp.]